MDLRNWLFYILCALSILGSACQKQPTTLDSPVPVETDMTFEEWLYRIQDDFSPDLISEIKEARQQIRYLIMTESSGLEFAESQRRVYAEITGESVRELLIKGIGLKIQREKDILKRSKFSEQRLVNRILCEADADHRAYLERSISALTERVKSRQQVLHDYEARLDALSRGRPSQSESVSH